MLLGYGWFLKLWSLFGYPKYWVAYYIRDPKRDHNFDNHPYTFKGCLGVLAGRVLELWAFGCIVQGLIGPPKRHISKNKDRDIPYKPPYNEAQ